MKLSIIDITILLDALRGSLLIKDGGRIFNYTEQTRKFLLDKMLNDEDMNKPRIELINASEAEAD